MKPRLNLMSALFVSAFVVVSTARYLQDHAWFNTRSRHTCTRDAQFDLDLSPTLGTPAPRLGHFDAAAVGGDTVSERFFVFLGFALVASPTGQTAVSRPTFWNAQGLPVGVQLTAAHGTESRLVSISTQIENARLWMSRMPKIAITDAA